MTFLFMYFCKLLFGRYFCCLYLDKIEFLGGLTSIPLFLLFRVFSLFLILFNLSSSFSSLLSSLSASRVFSLFLILSNLSTSSRSSSLSSLSSLSSSLSVSILLLSSYLMEDFLKQSFKHLPRLKLLVISFAHDGESLFSIISFF